MRSNSTIDVEAGRPAAALWAVVLLALFGLLALVVSARLLVVSDRVASEDSYHPIWRRSAHNVY